MGNLGAQSWGVDGWVFWFDISKCFASLFQFKMRQISIIIPIFERICIVQYTIHNTRIWVKISTLKKWLSVSRPSQFSDSIFTEVFPFSLGWRLKTWPSYMDSKRKIRDKNVPIYQIEKKSSLSQAVVLYLTITKMCNTCVQKRSQAGATFLWYDILKCFASLSLATFKKTWPAYTN